MRGKGEGSFFKNKEGFWVGRIELPSHSGERRHKKVTSKDKKVALRKFEAMKKELAERGDLPTATPTLATFLLGWVEEHAKHARPNTINNYRGVIRRHIIPSIGKHRLEHVTPKHIKQCTDRVTLGTAHGGAGLSPTYALNVHRVLSSALEHAHRQGLIGRNPAKAVKPPRPAKKKLEALTVDEAIRLLGHLATSEPDGARWATSLLTGARRGEVIGLEVDRVGDYLDLSWQLQRIIWQHGCGGVDSDGKGRCGFKRAASCGDRKLDLPADYEHRHVEGGLYLVRPKSSSGWRMIPLVDPLRGILERHIDQTKPTSLVFTRPDGRPIDPSQDTKEWRAVLERSGINKDVRLHDLRHSAVDFMYQAGYPEDVIVKIVGHSMMMQTRRYQSDGIDPRHRAAMESLSTLLTAKEIAA